MTKFPIALITKIVLHDYIYANWIFRKNDRFVATVHFLRKLHKFESQCYSAAPFFSIPPEKQHNDDVSQNRSFRLNRSSTMIGKARFLIKVRNPEQVMWFSFALPSLDLHFWPATVDLISLPHATNHIQPNQQT